MNCDVIRDLLPVYTDGLASQASKDLVEEHLETCADCRAALQAMGAPEPERAAEDRKELDFLKTARRKNRLSRLGIALAILLLTGAAFCLRTFVIGSESSADLVFSDANVEDTALTLRCSPLDSAGAIGAVKFSEADGVVTVTTRNVLASPLHAGPMEATYTASEPIQQVIVNDRVIWDEGADVSPFAARLYATRHAYVGSAPENIHTANALLLGPIHHSLDTDSRPYTWHIEIYESDHDPSTVLENFTRAELEQLNDALRGTAYVLLALVENLDQVSYDFALEGEPSSLVISTEDAAAFFGRDVKACYDSPRLFAALLQQTGINSSVDIGRDALRLTERTITVINGSDTELQAMSMGFSGVSGTLSASVAGQNADNSPLRFGESLSFNIPGWTLEDETMRLSVTTMDGSSYLIDQPISLAGGQQLTLKGSPETGFTVE